MRQLEPIITAQRRLDYFAYTLLQDGRTYFDRHWVTLNALEAAGFKVNATRKLAKNFDEIKRAAESHRPAGKESYGCVGKVFRRSFRRTARTCT